MEIGKVVELGERNSGFIKRSGVKDTLFFHADALIGMAFKDLKAGDVLNFRVTESRKGPYATEIRRPA
ncbi:MAG: cold shock domain-containing protein [Candidatus Pacebacteria bacterium]|nr:cold shock domain-containing protein [Candidatus Paceibacterota bacterium]MBP9840385.1 cold shock domain-containing protein [Candidatus Paceibacterota bacterium]